MIIVGSVAVYPEDEVQSVPIKDQFEAWIVASTLQTWLGFDDLTKYRFKTLHRQVLDLTEWLEGQAA